MAGNHSAASSFSNDSNVRENLLTSATSFLSSPHVKSTERSQTTSFLQDKGLTSWEIDEAFRQANNGVRTPDVSRPPVPARPLVYHVPRMVGPSQPLPMSFWRILTIAFFMGLSTAGVVAGMLSVVRRLISPILKSVAQYRRDRYNQRRVHLEDLSGTLQAPPELRSSSQALAVCHGKLTEGLDCLVNQIRTHVGEKARAPDRMWSLRATLRDFRHTFATACEKDSLRSSGYSRRPISTSPMVENFRTEVLSFKGILLNRKEFPIISEPSPPPPPLYHPRRRTSIRAELAAQAQMEKDKANEQDNK
ncbi:hypothetical protein DFQ28_009571 [Apophysomyces sp. BC1034]|nr:hypothetical protein DFQ30_002848 [Apophysomyces sp. BC1015]KAG0174820.1 hypothetical protein DFQ29_007345 [Apophysomyces sp. BC1021]KAG0185304.1 hypothetical protein DFQ28_009571 [Apophysomyces sp. BC1034]